MVIINRDLCNECMICTRVCPFNVMIEKDGRPQLDSNKKCIECMHCGAACPQKAIDFDNRPGVLERDLIALDDKFSENLNSLLLQRRSYRSFSEKKISQDVLEEALWLASYAPSAKNERPTKWIVIQDEVAIKKMMEEIIEYTTREKIAPEIANEYVAGRNVVFGNANTVLVGYGSTKAINPPVDIALETHTAEIVLQAQGIGTCWAGYFARLSNIIPGIKEKLDLGEGEKVFAALMMGYPKDEKYLHVPSRKSDPEIKWL
jgi:nitroreductase/NAD-dependent dihydropyrimidine dehydrogenase PreA subunit